jgi:hypothetical protein
MTYKRPLLEGEVCGDTRTEFNEYLGLGKGGDQAIKPLGKATAEAETAPLKAPKAKKEPQVEVPVEIVVATVDEVEAPVEAAE